ncbi:MAG: DNA repair protein RecN [Ignavibacteriales bacterium]|nr:DNA repair protein RecN [Ignavibacteriales bacterium]MCB9218425.1 DNA repair protein RecN [Ignavibacteriales bacterium]
MLTSLEIKDYALIQNINVEFSNGLNIITGETGAGKSILIGALGLLLGERASTETVRKGANKSYIEGIFDIGDNEKVKKFLEENDFEFNEELIVRREISIKGSNRCFINDTPVQLSVVKQIGDLLIDLHGQHDHQSLLRSETHIEFLDEFCDIKNELHDFEVARKKLLEALSQLKKLRDSEKNLKEKLSLNQFQLKEINSISPEKDEDLKIEKELNILENSEKLFESSSQIYSSIYENENNAYDILVSIKNHLEHISKIDEDFNLKLVDINSAIELVREIGDYSRDYLDKMEIDPSSIDALRDRAGAIHMLKKKYGGSLENVLSFKSKIEEELSLAENFADKIDELQKKIIDQREEVKKTAFIISKKRKNEAKKVEKQIEEVLKYLGIPDSKFEIRFEYENTLESETFVEVDKKKVNVLSNGIDVVEFFISTNLGEDLKPLVKTASGGEVSRIMLAIKSVMAKTEKLPLLVFDEIDTGISGRIAQKVGKILRDLSASHQIISITHLPQIAACANHHYSVQKETNSDRVVSLIKKLNEEEKVVEIAKLLSGEKITQSNLNAAKELLLVAN